MLLLLALIYSLVDVDSFLKATTRINDFFLDKFGWLFSLGTLLMLLSCIVIFFHPISKRRIGGENAKPFLSKWRWFSIVICTTIATGIIFWGTAEPIYHLNAPPSFSGTETGTATAGEYALSVMFLHWTFTPYAIYSIPAMMFALAFYNEKRSFSLKSTLYPFIPAGKLNWLGIGIDSICLYALVAGMAASLGAGILTLSGGIKNIFGLESNFILLLITITIVGAFVLSAISGLMKGIRILSDINIRIFILLALFIFVFGPTGSILIQAFDSLLHYLKHLPEFSLVSVLYPEDPWPKNWTSFNWANWLAWAPITALFLGRLSYGYTVKQFMIVNWILPSLFGMVWMSIFSGTVIDMQLNQGIDLNGLLKNMGPESIVYRMFETLPWKGIIAVVFLFTAFLSYVTAADSNTEAMGGISSTGISPDTPSPPKFIKVIWGLTIGAVAFIMISLAGVDGVKMLSNLGGLPALFLIITINLGLIKVLFFGKKV